MDASERSMSFTSHLNGHSSTSVISPLSLPHAIDNLSYLDESHVTNLSPYNNYSHSPSYPIPPRSRSQYRSSHLNPQSVCEQNPSSLSPTVCRSKSRAASPSVESASNHGMTSPPDNMNMNNQAALALLHRREEQNRRLLESWHAERAHLEANRARAEEVYQEERAIMDEERMIWIEERTRLEKDLSEWKMRAELAEKQRNDLAIMLKNAGKSFDGADEFGVGSIRGGGPGSPRARMQPPSKIQSPSEDSSTNTLPSSMLGTTMPESKPFIPLDPRMQGTSPGMISPKAQQDRVPSIDIQEVMPELEGIRVRPDAVQKSTFTDGVLLSPSTGTKRPAPPMAKNDSSRPRIAPTELTKEALQAPESDRLTMHAGHTPNHSMSLSRLHTVDPTDATNTVNSSGAATPKHQIEENAQNTVLGQHSQPEGTSFAAHIAPENSGFLPGLETIEPRPYSSGIPVPFDPITHEPERVLKGPLHLRNLPAADEPFLAALSTKLEHAMSTDPTPTVLKNDPFDEPRTVGEKSTVKAGGDGAHDTRDESSGEDEEDIPLKLKDSQNFGAPFGKLRKLS